MQLSHYFDPISKSWKLIQENQEAFNRISGYGKEKFSTTKEGQLILQTLKMD